MYELLTEEELEFLCDDNYMVEEIRAVNDFKEREMRKQQLEIS